MSEKQAIYSLSVCGRTILDMHSLNNEGGEGNQMATRMVNVVYRDRASGEYKQATVNAVSGDMLKHIQAEHFYLLAKGRLPLCQGCQKFSASRILDDKEFMDDLPKQDGQVIDALLGKCALDDLEGNLIAKKNRSVPRKSVAEFGWVVGIPDYTTTESYFHVRYATERGKPEAEAQQQAIYRGELRDRPHWVQRHLPAVSSARRRARAALLGPPAERSVHLHRAQRGHARHPESTHRGV
jgi:CRISPR-associated protein Cst2